MEKRTGNYRTCPYAGHPLCFECDHYDTCYMGMEEDEIFEIEPEEEE